MISPQSGRAIALWLSAIAVALQLGACNRAEDAQKAANASAPVAVTAGQSEPRRSGPASSGVSADETETGKPTDLPATVKERDAAPMPRPEPAKPSFDPRKGLGGLEPPRLLQA